MQISSQLLSSTDVRKQLVIEDDLISMEQKDIKTKLESKYSTKNPNFARFKVAPLGTYIHGYSEDLLYSLILKQSGQMVTLIKSTMKNFFDRILDEKLKNEVVAEHKPVQISIEEIDKKLVGLYSRNMLLFCLQNNGVVIPNLVDEFMATHCFRWIMPVT